MSEVYSNRKGIKGRDVALGLVAAALMTWGTCKYVSKSDEVDSLSTKTDSLEAKTQNDALHIHDLRTGLDSLEERVYFDSVNNLELGGVIDALGFKNEKLKKDKSQLLNEISRLKKAGANPDYIAKLEGKVNALEKERNTLRKELKNYEEALKNGGDSGKADLIKKYNNLVKENESLANDYLNLQKSIGKDGTVPVDEYNKLMVLYKKMEADAKDAADRYRELETILSHGNTSGKRGSGKKSYDVTNNKGFLESMFESKRPKLSAIVESGMLFKDDAAQDMQVIVEYEGSRSLTKAENETPKSDKVAFFKYPPINFEKGVFYVHGIDKDGNVGPKYALYVEGGKVSTKKFTVNGD